MVDALYLLILSQKLLLTKKESKCETLTVLALPETK